MPVAYYNEHDPFAAAWLRALIAADMITLGDVDERSIEDVRPDDLRPYGQHHFFAGIGVWSAALRAAGWDDDRPVWTGSCPCQPFSAAGKGAGFDDERHLWPAWFWLIRELRPDVLFGEQVAAPAGLQWFDLVSSDLEGEGYAIGAHDLCAAGVGAPHIRQRLWFVAHHHHQRQHRRPAIEQDRRPEFAPDRGVGGRLAHADGRHTGAERQQSGGQHGQQQEDGRAGPVVDAAGEQTGLPGRARQPGGADHQLADTVSARRPEGWAGAGLGSPASSSSTRVVGHHHHQGLAQRPLQDVERGTVRDEGATPGPAGLLRGAWGDAEWIPCRDGKWRPVESGTFPLAHGAPARVGRLRGYGNAICLPVAQAFIEAAMSVMP